MKEESGRFYIDGKVYESWSQVPEKYRRDGTDHNPAEPIEVTFFDFDF